MRNLRTIRALSLILVFTFLSCGGPDPLEKALRHAGDNRAELEKVLAHYSQDPADSLKLRAAEYLIKFMPYHKSYEPAAYEAYSNAVDSVLALGISADAKKEELLAVSWKFGRTTTERYDMEVVTADYLIDNIETSFYLWDNMNSADHLCFDEFCEYILPYKCREYQPLDDWKTLYRDSLKGLLDVLPYCDEFEYNARRAAETVMAEIKTRGLTMKWTPDLDIIDVNRPSSLLKMPFGDCFDQAYAALAYMRSKGIPISIDFTPNWSDQQYGHYWCNIFATARHTVDFTPYRPGFPGSQWNYGDKKFAKVFRKSYTPHPLLLEAMENGETLPQSLGYLFCRDVTGEYTRTVNVSLKTELPKGTRYAYAAVFDNFDWVPVDIGRAGKTGVDFTDLGVGVLYMPMVQEEDRLEAAGDPFIINTRREVVTIKPDTAARQQVRLYRKFATFTHVFNNYKSIQNGKILASNDPSFRDAVTIAELPEWSLTSGTEAVSDTVAYRYYRLMASGSQSTDFAEIFFFDRYNQRVDPEIIPCGLAAGKPGPDNPENILDGDALTYVTLQGDEKWVGFDFGEPVLLDRVSYIRRSDGNDIFPGDTYQLSYWDDGRWNIVGTRTAEDIFIDFDNAPCDALFYIKCINRGTNNRIFTYEEGKPRWW